MPAPRPTAMLVAAALLVACGQPLENLTIESRAVTRIHVPKTAQVAQPFTIFVDVDSACGEFRRVTTAENGLTRTITCDVMFKPPQPGAGCLAVVLLRRYETSVVPTSVGTYEVEFKGLSGRHSASVNVVATEAPAWSPPAFNAGDTTPNY